MPSRLHHRGVDHFDGQSGLFKHLLPIFEKKAGIQVRVVALGTGQAMDLGKRGDADVVFVHAKSLEEGS